MEVKTIRRNISRHGWNLFNNHWFLMLFYLYLERPANSKLILKKGGETLSGLLDSKYEEDIYQWEGPAAGSQAGNIGNTQH